MVSQTFFQKVPFKETKEAMAPSDKILKYKLPLKTLKTFFSLHHQLQDI